MSGLWLDYKIQTVEDQQKFAVPMTRDTETLFYNVRMLIDSNVETEMRAWLISKVNRISPNGICRVTLTQDIFDQHKDYIERDESGNIVGKWADYFSSNVEPTPITPDEDQSISSSTVTSKITCSGKPQFKIGGSAKTFTVTYYNEDNEVVEDYPVGNWTFSVDGVPVDEELLTLTLDGNKVKVKFLGNDSYIGKILTVTNTSGDAIASLQIEIIAL